jgi:hypothetical protein
MQRNQILCRTIIAASIAGLTACGGGGSGGSNASDGATATATATYITGTAAAGAPLAGATVTLTDANGTQRTATASADGSFTLEAQGLAAPLVLSATGTIGDIPATFIAVAADGPKAGEGKTLNVTPLTTAVAALLSDDSDPMQLTDPAVLNAKATPAQLAAVVAALRSILHDVLQSAGANATTFDPMTTPFRADRTGLDAVLDAVKVSLSDHGVVLTNAFAPVAESATDLAAVPTAAVALTKANLANPPAALAAPTLPIAAITALADQWRDEINACFAQAAAERATLDDQGGVTGLKGACAATTRFDPSYKSNGYRLLQHFGSLLSDPDMDGARFAQPEVLTLIKTAAGEDRAVFRVFYKRRDGTIGDILDVAQKTAAAGAGDNGWRVVGNQLDFDAGVHGRVDRLIPLTAGAKEEHRSSLRLSFNPLGPNANDVTMVRITGPGLPAAGVVLGKSNTCGTANYLPIQNKAGTLSVSDTNTATASAFVLGAAYADGTPYSWRDAPANWAETPLSDFSSLRPFMRYKFEVYKTTGKVEFYTRLTTPPVAPRRAKALPWQALGASSMEYLDPAHPTKAAAQTAVSVEWQRNMRAAPVEAVNVYGAAPGARLLAQKLDVKPGDGATTVAADALGTSFGASCAGMPLPALNTAGGYREITLRTRNGSGLRQYATWSYQQ